MLDFKKTLDEERIIISNVELVNFLVQKNSAEDYVIRIVDNVGSPVMIPLAYYFDYFADKRLERYWKRFIELLRNSYPEIFDEERIDRIK